MTKSCHNYSSTNVCIRIEDSVVIIRKIQGYHVVHGATTFADGVRICDWSVVAR